MKKIAGKTFMTSEEAGLDPLTPQDTEDIKQRIRKGRAPQPQGPPERDPLFRERLQDDLKGTEFDPDRPPKSADDIASGA